jgi:hypothetical protein
LIRFSGPPIVLTFETRAAPFPANTCDISEDSPEAKVLERSLEPWRKEKPVITFLQHANTVSSTFSNPFTDAILASRPRGRPYVSELPLS